MVDWYDEELGFTSMARTTAMTGAIVARMIARVKNQGMDVAAVVSAITAGLLVGRSNTRPAQPPAGGDAGCCSSDSSCGATKPAMQIEVTSSCCSADAAENSCCGSEPAASVDRDWFSGIRYAFTDLLGGILFWLAVGLLFSAAVQTWLPSDFLARWGSGLPAMLVMIAVSIPMYVCATASTPIAAGLLMAGISPGTVLVFLLAGPASNIGSMGIIRRELGQRALAAYLAGVAVTAIASGLLLDWFLQLNGIGIQSELAASEHLVPHWLAWTSLLLLALASLNLLRNGKSG